ncbi:MAG: relaxase domain-containing protein [Acidobacteriota bacterium]|nr:relaxase domain-containing protein [Acidobacteriota bacterium]
MRTEPPAIWVIAAYQHDSSRELDPQLHLHSGGCQPDLPRLGRGLEGAAGLWDLRTSGITLPEVHRNALACSVREYGYQIVERFENGKERGFEIAGIRPETLEEFNREIAVQCSTRM